MAKSVVLFLVFLVGITGCKDICSDLDYCKKILKETTSQGAKIKNKTISILEKSCKKDNLEVCKSLGDFYKSQGNDFLATKFFSKVCKSKNDLACFESGLALERLDNPHMALDNYYYGCLLSQGGKSCSALGDFFSHRSQWEAAAIFYKKACDKSNVGSCSKMARIVLRYLPYFEKREFYYKKYFKKSCSGEDFYSCYFLAKLLFDEGKKNLAEDFFYKACFGNIQDACDFYLENYGSRWDSHKNKARLWLDFFLKKVGLQ